MNHNLNVFSTVCDALISNITLETTSLTADYDELATVQDLADLLNTRGIATKQGKPFNRHNLTMLLRRTVAQNDIDELKLHVGADGILGADAEDMDFSGHGGKWIYNTFNRQRREADAAVETALECLYCGEDLPEFNKWFCSKRCYHDHRAKHGDLSKYKAAWESLPDAFAH